MARTRFFTPIATAALFAALAGCTVHKQDAAPSLTGPSGLGTNITIQVSPDELTQDGASQSVVTITATDSNGQPLRNLSLRVDITVDDVITDFGTLSARNVVTDANGRATVVYTAPAAPAGAVDTDTMVVIQATPAGTDFGNQVASHVATIRLVPAGVIGAPPSALKPGFNVPSANVGDTALFTATVVDAKGADATAQVSSFMWSFGDGGTAQGRSVSHVYNQLGTFPVTLTITDTVGRTAFITQSMTVGQGTLPIATFVFSPGSPSVGQTVNFNASGSTAAPGHVITDFAWNFGDGTLGSGSLATHAYAQDGTYTVTLKVTDDVGRKSTLASQPVTVGLGGPTAAFTFAPSSPASGQQVVFDASTSRPTSGRSIVSYSWNFDDGTTGSGVQTTHTYSAKGAYQVLLTVTDDAGQTGSTTHTVTVTDSSPTASFTFSPTQPIVSQPVNFDGSQSTPAAGRTIVSYSWAFGDGTAAGPTPGPTIQHAFSSPGNYVVRLTVTDDLGKTGSTTQTVPVGSDSPVASFTFAPASPTAPATVNFDGTSSTAAPGRTIVSYSWTFQGGAPATNTTSATPTTAYAVAGTYTIVLTVTDNVGKMNTATKFITVQ